MQQQQRHLPPPPAAVVVGTPSVTTHEAACPMAYDHLLHTVAVLEHTAYDNAALDAAHLLQGAAPGLTPFHSSSVPPMRLAPYVDILARRTAYGRFGVAAGIALVARYLIAASVDLTPLTMHRLFAMCIQVGMKTNADYFVRNSYFADVAGFPLPEFNRLEVELLRVLEYRVMPSKREFWSMPVAINSAYATAMAAAAAAAPSQQGADQVQAPHVASHIMDVVDRYAFARPIVAASPSSSLPSAPAHHGSFPVAHSVPLHPEELVTPTAAHGAPLAFAAHGGKSARGAAPAAAGEAPPLSDSEPAVPHPTFVDDEDESAGAVDDTPSSDALHGPRRRRPSDLYVSQSSGVSPPYALQPEDSAAAADDAQTPMSPTCESCASSTFPADEAAAPAAPAPAGGVRT